MADSHPGYRLARISIVPAPANPDTRFLSLKGEIASSAGDFAWIFARLKEEDSKSATRRKSTEPITFASFEL